MNPETSGRALHFGMFELDLRTRQLRKGGRRIRLQDHSFSILARLLEHPGDVVTRDELRRTLWSDGTIVDFENGLNTAMGKLRQVLRDSAENPRFIETVPRQGYRFIAVLDPTAEAANEEPPQTTNGPPPRKHLPYWMAAVAMLLLAAGYFAGRSVSLGGGSDKHTLAVLTFQDLDPGAPNQYIADGITEELTTRLSRLQPENLRVIARTSAMQYRLGSKSAFAVGKELGADYLLEGSVRHSQDKLRVTAQLIRVSDQTHIWAGNYDRGLGEVLTLELEIANMVAHRIQVTLTPDARARLRPAKPVNPAAYDAYLKGRFFQTSQDLTRESMTKSAEFFTEALRIDSNFAPAYAGLAEYYGSRAQVMNVVMEQDCREGKRNAARAVELDGDLAEAHLAAAWMATVCDRDWPFAGREFGRMLDLDPNLVRGRALYSVYLLALGRTEAAVDEIRRALAVDPSSLLLRSHASRTLLLSRRYDEAVAESRKRLELNPSSAGAAASLARAYAFLGKHDEAMQLLQPLPKNYALETRVLVDVPSGRRREAEAILNGLVKGFREGSVDSYSIAVIHALLGNPNEALGWLERGEAAGNPYIPLRLRVDPMLDSLRTEPRFQALVRRMNYPD